MIKASELRIGNLVNTYGVANAVTKVNELYLTLSKTPSISFSNGNLEPIPLTEEWVLKFGFKKYKGWDDMDFWYLPKDINNYNRFELYETSKGYELPSGNICEYVHQLQNCFYFHNLNGEELEIKEEV